MIQLMIKYEYVDNEKDPKIKFTDGVHSGIVIKLGKVEFEEVGEDCHMKYEYDVIRYENEYDKPALDRQVGDLLIQLIEQGVKDRELIYAGGTDEN